MRGFGADPETIEAPAAEPVSIQPGRRQFVCFCGDTHEAEVGPFIQPENPPYTDPENFTIGTKDHHGWYKQAIPYPKWPRPGHAATDEERDLQVGRIFEAGKKCNFYR